MAYHSVILGTSVARTGVLAFANLVVAPYVQLERRNLAVEAASLDGVVISDGRRRFQLLPKFWAGAHRLCDQPWCPEKPACYRTLCEAHTTEGGSETVREQTSLFAERYRQERDWMIHVQHDLMRELMEVAVAVGLPAAEHAQYFAERLHLADADQTDDWDYEEREPAINEDQERLLHSVIPRQNTVPISEQRGVPRQIGPLDPLQLPGSPRDLRLEFSYKPERLAPCSQDTVQWWSVSVNHRPSDSDPEPPLGHIGRLALARLSWGQEEYTLGSVRGEQYSFGRLASTVFDAWQDPDNKIHQLGLEAHGDLLVLLDVQLDQAWKGFGLGAFLAVEALDFLGAGCRLAAADIDDEDSPQGRLVRAAGFHLLDGGLAIRNCVGSRNDGHRRQLALQHDQVARFAEPERGVHAEPPF
ncbi:hypothetical protein [Streptomyces sp. NBC_00258]|uniref:hypothetical protein n=1 Tax=Streptomyces sp. NBC_00258 TaxID=2903642 RepID=UPI002E290B5B|nr:hypothetical protein [Streptomyces sp. NBC_00258]